MRRLRILRACALVLGVALTLARTVGATAEGAPPVPRVEARSAGLLAVGLVRGAEMSIHLSRTEDNSPLRDADVKVVLRGVVHPTTAEPDGSYALRTRDLELPGTAGVIFQVTRGDVRDELKGELQNGGLPAKQEDRNSARQLGWWILNFAVCIGFLMLWSRRRKAAEHT